MRMVTQLQQDRRDVQNWMNWAVGYLSSEEVVDLGDALSLENTEGIRNYSWGLEHLRFELLYIINSKNRGEVPEGVVKSLANEMHHLAEKLRDIARDINAVAQKEKLADVRFRTECFSLSEGLRNLFSRIENEICLKHPSNTFFSRFLKIMNLFLISGQPARLCIPIQKMGEISRDVQPNNIHFTHVQNEKLNRYKDFLNWKKLNDWIGSARYFLVEGDFSVFATLGEEDYPDSRRGDDFNKLFSRGAVENLNLYAAHIDRLRCAIQTFSNKEVSVGDNLKRFNSNLDSACEGLKDIAKKIGAIAKDGGFASVADVKEHKKNCLLLKEKIAACAIDPNSEWNEPSFCERFGCVNLQFLTDPELWKAIGKKIGLIEESEKKEVVRSVEPRSDFCGKLMRVSMQFFSAGTPQKLLGAINGWENIDLEDGKKTKMFLKTFNAF